MLALILVCMIPPNNKAAQYLIILLKHCTLCAKLFKETASLIFLTVSSNYSQ